MKTHKKNIFFIPSNNGLKNMLLVDSLPIEKTIEFYTKGGV